MAATVLYSDVRAARLDTAGPSRRVVVEVLLCRGSSRLSGQAESQGLSSRLVSATP